MIDGVECMLMVRDFFFFKPKLFLLVEHRQLLVYVVYVHPTLLQRSHTLCLHIVLGHEELNWSKWNFFFSLAAANYYLNRNESE